MAMLSVTQRRSSNGCNRRQLDTLRSLGLRRIGQTVELADSAQTRGMLHAIRHLVEVDGAQQRAAAKPSRAAKTAKPSTPAEAPAETAQ